ncbi:MAG: clan AA aspartic protease [Hellea sp.]|nr:clan AA aspartic protease [Hellea sp.]
MDVRNAIIALIVSIISLTGISCSSTTIIDGVEGIELRKLIGKKDVIALPYEETARGLIIIPVQTEFGQSSFLIDTGATRSALFKGSEDSLIDKSEFVGVANIIGLVNSGHHQMVKVAELNLGKRRFKDMTVAVLPERTKIDNELMSIDPGGIIGMDVLAEYNLLVDADEKQIYFIPFKYPKPFLSRVWKPVYLYHNPHSALDKNLHFFDVRVGNHIIPAILDSGAEFNVINWEATIIPEIRRLQRRLRKDWEIQGALGEFDPAVKIDVNFLRAGQMSWRKSQFIIMNFDHLDGLGFADKPLVIAGSSIFQNQSFYLNFDSNQLWLKTEGLTAVEQRTGEANHSVTFDTR